MRRLLACLTLLALVTAINTVPAGAGDGPKGPTDALQRYLRQQRSHLRADTHAPSAPRAGLVANHFDVLGHLGLPSDEVNADVGFFDFGGGVGKFAFVGSWSGRCAGTGVKVVDVNDPTSPALVSIAGTHVGESHEDMDVMRIGHRVVMAIGVQQCGDGGRSGVDLFDITDPSDPYRISFFRTPPGGVHELDVVQRPGGRVLALLAVPFVEFANTFFGANDGGEFRIVDITDPSHPWEVSNWGIIADSSLPIVAGKGEVTSSYQGLGTFAAYFAHSARAADHGMTAYVSYWDGGILKFDISDPSHPRLLARTKFPLPADGDGHSMTPFEVGGHRFILQNDEDGDPASPPTVKSSATGQKRFLGIEEGWAPTNLTKTGPISDRVVDAGEGCHARDFAGAAGKIALADSVDPFYEGIINGWPHPPCTIGRQTILAAQAGATAFVSNLISPDDAYPYFFGNFDMVQQVAKGMPVVQISQIDGEARRIRDALAGGPVRMQLVPSPPTHGYLRVFREDVGTDHDGDGVTELRQVGKFDRLPYVAGALSPPAGSWEIHNTEVLARRGYSSWYSNGIVAFALGVPSRPRLVGQFVPPASSRFRDVFGPPFPMVWGVAIDHETGIVYTSDMRSGLWIVQPKGAAAP
jgi:hypothetical protein